MTGNFRALADTLRDYLDAYDEACQARDRKYDNRHGSGPDTTPHDNTVAQAEDAVRNAAHNLTRLT